MRSSHPVGVCLSPGVPDSWKSWASKCERVTWGLPTAWMKASRPSLKYGWSGASSGCIPKVPSRFTTPSELPGRGRAMPWRRL